MRGIHVQRSSGVDHAASIREELYIPEREVAYGAHTQNLMDTPLFYTTTEKQMSPMMLVDLRAAAGGEVLERKDYSISINGEAEFTEAQLDELERKISRHHTMRTQGADSRDLATLSDDIFGTITLK